jgi:hypothetical protein
MRNQILDLLLALVLFLLCLSIAYCYCKTVLSSETVLSTFHIFLIKTLGYLITHYALLSSLSPKLEKELGNDAQWMLMYAHSSFVSKTLEHVV